MGRVIFYEDRCKGCKLCTTACPKKIVVMDTGRLNAKGFHPAAINAEDMEKCTSCAFCAIICPDIAIEVEK